MKWKMQGVEFQTDLLVTLLKGWQMVLGIQWLILLGSITWNFKELRMECHVGNNRVVLRGCPQPWLQIMQCKTLRKSSQLSIEQCKVQLCSLVVMKEKLASDVNNDNKLDKLPR